MVKSKTKEKQSTSKKETERTEKRTKFNLFVNILNLKLDR